MLVETGLMPMVRLSMSIIINQRPISRLLRCDFPYTKPLFRLVLGPSIQLVRKPENGFT